MQWGRKKVTLDSGFKMEIRPLVKSVYLKIIFLIYQSKHLLWRLNERGPWVEVKNFKNPEL